MFGNKNLLDRIEKLENKIVCLEQSIKLKTTVLVSDDRYLWGFSQVEIRDLIFSMMEELKLNAQFKPGTKDGVIVKKRTK